MLTTQRDQPMTLSDLTNLTDELQTLVSAYQAARDAATDTEWDQLSEGPLQAVLDSLAEIEDITDR